MATSTVFPGFKGTPAQLRVLKKLFNTRQAPGSPVWTLVGQLGTGTIVYTLMTKYWWGSVDRTETATIRIPADGEWIEYTVKRCDRPISSSAANEQARAKDSERTVTNPKWVTE